MARFLDVLMVLAGLSATAMGAVVVRDRFFHPAPAPVTAPTTAHPAIDRDEWHQLSAAVSWKGPADRKAQVIEFADFQCPFCARLHPALEHIVSSHGDSVSFGFGHFPLREIHNYAYPAAISAVCAERQGRFSAMADELYGHQELLGMISFDSIAHLAGVKDRPGFHRCLADPSAQGPVDTGLVWAGRLALNETPTVYVNGVLVPAEEGAAGVEAAVEKALAAH